MGYSGISIVCSIRIIALREKPTPPSRKYTIKCLIYDKELKGINNSYFAKDHLIDNLTHLEYRVFVNVLSTTDATSKFP